MDNFKNFFVDSSKNPLDQAFSDLLTRGARFRKGILRGALVHHCKKKVCEKLGHISTATSLVHMQGLAGALLAFFLSELQLVDLDL